MNIEVRQEYKEDYNAVFEVNQLAFAQDNEAKLVDLLRNSSAFIPELSLVATINSEVIGHILFTSIKIVNNNYTVAESLALAPMAVKPAFQHKGIGSLLVRSGLNKARELKYKSVIVLGHQHYYPKFGFIPAKQWNIKSPYDVPDNVFMALELFPDALNHLGGLVKYADEFNQL